MIDSFQGEFRFLSNFYPSVITVNGLTYSSVEHAFQAAKTLDLRLRDLFTIPGMTPGQAKRLGRIVDLRSDWEQVKDDVMYECLQEKFKDPILRQQLVNTGDEWLIEGNNWGDKYWGTVDGVGANRLGELLMRLRSECQKVD